MAKTPTNIVVKFTEARLTHYGGAYLLHQFFQYLTLRQELSSFIRIPERNAVYHTSEFIVTLLYPLIFGLERIETTQLLKYNGLFRFLTGLRQHPNPTTIRRFLKRLGHRGLSRLLVVHDRYRRRLLNQPKTLSKFYFDCDTTVLTVYGQQEKTRKGYNPKKPGRRSYQPLFCFEGQTGDCWAGELYSGDTHPAVVILPMLEAAMAKLPRTVRRKFFRGDKAFFAKNLVNFLEFYRFGYAIVARLTQPIKRQLPGLRYRRRSSHIAVAEFRYQPHGWKKRHRFIVIRRRVTEEPTQQLSLFKMGRYTYQVIVTNLKLKPINVWRFYNRRATAELVIRELKEGYATGKIPTKHFSANSAFFQITLLAYNLLMWFKRLCLPESYRRMTIETLRHRLLVIPAELVYPKGRPTLKLSESYPDKTAFIKTLENIKNLKKQNRQKQSATKRLQKSR
jgi:hypothetical protein